MIRNLCILSASLCLCALLHAQLKEKDQPTRKAKRFRIVYIDGHPRSIPIIEPAEIPLCKPCQRRHESPRPGKWKYKCDCCQDARMLVCADCTGHYKSALRPTKCSKCKATGDLKCRNCRGRGWIRCTGCNGDRRGCKRCKSNFGRRARGWPLGRVLCPRGPGCMGTGRVACSTCTGTGQVLKKRTCRTCSKGRVPCPNAPAHRPTTQPTSRPAARP